MRAHVNMCDICARDVERILELRSQAALRGKIRVKPGMSSRREFGWSITWKRALAGVSMAAVIAAVALSLGRIGSAPVNPNQVASNKPNGDQIARVAPLSATNTRPNRPVPAIVAAVPQSGGKPTGSTAPPQDTLIKDGSYRVIKQDGRLKYEKANGSSAEAVLEARIAASIEEKLRTGKVKPGKPVQMAMAGFYLRDPEQYAPPTTAPRQISPVNVVIMSATPTFTWSKVDLAQAYRLTVTDKDGNAVIDEITAGNSFTMTKPIERDLIYSWRVAVRFGETDSWATSRAANFKMLSSEDAASLQSIKHTLPGSHLALGAAYEAFGLYNDAAAQYRALLRENPHSDLARKLLLGLRQAGG